MQRFGLDVARERWPFSFAENVRGGALRDRFGLTLGEIVEETIGMDDGTMSWPVRAGARSGGRLEADLPARSFDTPL